MTFRHFPLWGALALAGATTPILPAAAETIQVAAGDAAALQAAITASVDGDVIELLGGVYNAPATSFRITNPNKRITLRSAQGVTAVLDGGGSYPVLRYQASNETVAGTVIFQDLIFRNGHSTQDGITGAVTVNRGKAHFERCSFEDNVSDAPVTGGGGVGIFTATAFFDECVFSGNFATNESGGLRLGGGARVFIHRSQFLGNRVNLAGHRPSSTGGGIGVVNSFLYVTNTRFEGNEAGFAGGGIYALSPWTLPWNVDLSEVWLANDTFVDNRVEPASGISTPTPSEGGGVHMEDQVALNVYNSRFVTNTADIGGGVNTLRGRVLIENSVFRGNRAQETGSGTGFGGAIAANSNDGPGDGSDNFPNAELTVRDSFIQGRYGAVGVVAQAAGGINATGDQSRQYGLSGVSKQGTLSVNRMTANLNHILFADLDVEVTPGAAGTGFGGALSTALSNMTITDSMVLGCDALGTGGVAGGLRLVIETQTQMNDTVLAGNTADLRGGAVFMQGADVSIDGSTFVHNALTPANELFGAAIFAAQLDNFAGNPYPMTGTVSNSLFSENSGVTVFDDDRVNGPINDERYNGNTFYRGPSTTIYWDAIGGGGNAAALNALVVDRNAPVPDTDKSQVNNLQPGSSPVFGAISHAPLKILNTVAAGDLETSTEAFLGYAWSGASATVGGSPVAGNAGWQSVGTGTHTLTVGAQSFNTTVSTGPTPAATFTASPGTVSPGGSSTLTWSLNAGTFLHAELDFFGEVASSGSMVVTPNVTTTYHLFVMTKEGGVLKSATVTVAPLDVIFTDGFESGNVSAWSSSTGVVP